MLCSQTNFVVLKQLTFYTAETGTCWFLSLVHGEKLALWREYEAMEPSSIKVTMNRLLQAFTRNSNALATTLKVSWMTLGAIILLYSSTSELLSTYSSCDVTTTKFVAAPDGLSGQGTLQQLTQVLRGTSGPNVLAFIFIEFFFFFFRVRSEFLNALTLL